MQPSQSSLLPFPLANSVKPIVALIGLLLAGCDNTTYSPHPAYTLFETSSGVVYLLNQHTGDREIVSSGHPVTLAAGDRFQDDEGVVYQYLGEGRVSPVVEPAPGIGKPSDG